MWRLINFSFSWSTTTWWNYIVHECKPLCTEHKNKQLATFDFFDFCEPWFTILLDITVISLLCSIENNIIIFLNYSEPEDQLTPSIARLACLEYVECRLAA